ncbi:FAD-binding domain-containing protein [Russula earlei]|uniref:FAD-binding domain-containing protein n=1 Tax=Russula earlei TaxID=71964 RepID=A0ACC0TZL6_9AGAM|nr:FAD-binding domain-containing protein [Russula earlei]
MMFPPLRFLTVNAIVVFICGPTIVHAWCRNQPGDPGYPSVADWSTFNDTISGRLLSIVPSAEACRELSCTEAQWKSGIFRQTIPGSMNAYNWEQDYGPPPQLCLRNGSDCAQGNVPLFAAGIRFAQVHSLRVVIKSSGHDYLGRSTAKNSLLLWTAFLKNITFTDQFSIAGVDHGPAVTVGSGVGLKTLYVAAKAQDKMFIGGTAATVSPAGGYTQGAGHSAFSPLYGLAADNVLQFNVVLADWLPLFWAMRGGGAGSWGVIIDATFPTLPIFNVTLHTVNVLTATLDQTDCLMATHAMHINDWDDVGAGQYFYLTGSKSNSTLVLSTLFKDLDGEASKSQMSSFLADVTALGAVVQGESTVTTSRLVPSTVYTHPPKSVGSAYRQLLSQDVQSVLGHLVAGGRVAVNAKIDSAVIATKRWDSTLSAEAVQALRLDFTATVRPVLEELAGGASSGSYSN